MPGTPAALCRNSRLSSPARGVFRNGKVLESATLTPWGPGYSATRVDRAPAPPELQRQRFARSSYRHGMCLTGSCNSIFKDEHPSCASTALTSRPERVPRFTARHSLRRPRAYLRRRFLPMRRWASDSASDVRAHFPRAA